jgi:hypothetical protein
MVVPDRKIHPATSGPGSGPVSRLHPGRAWTIQPNSSDPRWNSRSVNSSLPRAISNSSGSGQEPIRAWEKSPGFIPAGQRAHTGAANGTGRKRFRYSRMR